MQSAKHIAFESSDFKLGYPQLSPAGSQALLLRTIILRLPVKINLLILEKASSASVKTTKTSLEGSVWEFGKRKSEADLFS